MPILAHIAYYVIQGLIFLIVISSLMSWFNPNPRNPLVRAVHAVVDPLLHPIRSLLPSAMGVDFSPMVAVLLLWVLRRLIEGGLTPGGMP
ncbi:MAG: YggT family protein [Firmicutes bacterium]|nr:YggT family protein [Bacillota bacterium]